MALLGQLLHPRQFVHAVVHCVTGVIVAWCCAVTIGGRYGTLAHPCTQGERWATEIVIPALHERYTFQMRGSSMVLITPFCFESSDFPQMCLNEYHLILLLTGAFIGFSHSLLGVVHNMNYVSFHTVQVCYIAPCPFLQPMERKHWYWLLPLHVYVAFCFYLWSLANAISVVFQQHKYLCFKGTLPLVVKCSATQALYSVRNYLVVYFFLGKCPLLYHLGPIDPWTIWYGYYHSLEIIYLSSKASSYRICSKNVDL